MLDGLAIVSIVAVSLIAVGVIVFLVLAATRFDQGLAKPLRDLAEANGWRFDAVGPERLLDRFRPFSPLRKTMGGAQRSAFAQEDEDTGDHGIRNVVSGVVRMHHFHVFEYDWAPNAEARRQKAAKRLERFTVAAVRTAVASPGLTLRRRAELPARLRDRPSDIPRDDPAFSARFLVIAPQHEFAQQVLHKSAREWVLPSAVDWEWRGHWLVVSWQSRLKAVDVIPVLKKLTGFTDRLPASMRPRPRRDEEDEWQEEGWPEAP